MTCLACYNEIALKRSRNRKNVSTYIFIITVITTIIISISNVQHYYIDKNAKILRMTVLKPSSSNIGSNMKKKKDISEITILEFG